MTPAPAERRETERRVSPAVGQYAIQECARLRESNKLLREALQALIDLDDGDQSGLWPFTVEFEDARAAIASATWKRKP